MGPASHSAAHRRHADRERGWTEPAVTAAKDRANEAGQQEPRSGFVQLGEGGLLTQMAVGGVPG